MKKTGFGNFVFILFIGSLILFSSCDQPTNEKPPAGVKYQVSVIRGTVDNGTDSDEYLVNATVKITAKAPANAGEAFSHWTASPDVTLNDLNSSVTTFTMPAFAVTLTAHFDTSYEVTVVGGTLNDGTDNGWYAENSTVQITADAVPQDKLFKNWTSVPAVVFADAGSAVTSFPMLAQAVVVTANFETAYTVTVISESPYASGTGVYAQGEEVAIKAGTPLSGKHFVNWSVNSGSANLDDFEIADTSFTMPNANVTVTANFAVTLVHHTVNIISEGTGAKGSGEYYEGEPVIITAGIPPEGMVFNSWTANPALVFTHPNSTGQNSSVTQFVMPSEAVTLTANFVPLNELILFLTPGIPGHFYGATAAPVRDETNNMWYGNYQNGYAAWIGGTVDLALHTDGTTWYYTVDGSQLVKVVGGKNVDSNMEETFLGFTGGFSHRLSSHAWTLNYAASGTFLGGIPAETVTRAFQDKYAELAGYVGYNYDSTEADNPFPDGEKFNAGVWRDRPIDAWDASIWLPMAWGDSSGQSAWFPAVPGISYLVYNRVENKVYIVKDEIVSIWMPQWGDAINDIGNHTFKINGVSAAINNSQQFLNGFSYIENGIPYWVPGVYDNANNDYLTVIPAHYTVHSARFGNPVGNLINAIGSIFINYDYGCIEAVPVNGRYTFTYVYYYAKNADASGVLNVLSAKAAAITALQTFDIQSGAIPAGVPVKIESAYQDLLVNGRVAGMYNHGSYIFNNVIIQPFWWGDGDYWVTYELNSAYMAYNELLDQVFLISDFATAWVANAGGLGAPVGNSNPDSFKINDVQTNFERVQKFEGGFIYLERGAIKTKFGVWDNGEYIGVNYSG